MLRTATVALALAAIAFGAGASEADAIDDYVNSQIKELRVAGLSLAVVEGGRLVKAQGYGLANVELGVSATPETVYEIASLTKPFTACAVLLLTEAGKVRLDDKVADYVDGLPVGWEGVSVRQLLNHTS